MREVQLIFDQTSSGAINIADMAFADTAKNKPPQVSCSVATGQLPFAGDPLVDVGLTVNIVDDHDLATLVEVLVYSDEDDLDSNNNQSSPDAKDLSPGTLRLRGERDKNGDGRVYVILVKSTDSGGAVGYGCCSVTVPAGNKIADIESVNAQATAALDLCTSFRAASDGLVALPSGFFVVGDGPTIGPNQ